jgi:RNA polymerase sigma-70 factor (ECF subfamily)
MESELIKRVLHSGDQFAFATLVKSHQCAVRGFLRRLTGGDVELAEDLAQETFIKAYQNISSYKQKSRFISWLLSIAYQEFAREYRKNKELKKYISLTQSIDDAEHALRNTDSWEKEQNASIAELTIERLMSKLDQREQILLTLTYQMGMTNREISTIMNLPLGTVKSGIRRARITLASLLGIEDDSEDQSDISTDKI